MFDVATSFSHVPSWVMATHFFTPLGIKIHSAARWRRAPRRVVSVSQIVTFALQAAPSLAWANLCVGLRSWRGCRRSNCAFLVIWTGGGLGLFHARRVVGSFHAHGMAVCDEPRFPSAPKLDDQIIRVDVWRGHFAALLAHWHNDRRHRTILSCHRRAGVGSKSATRGILVENAPHQKSSDEVCCTGPELAGAAPYMAGAKQQTYFDEGDKFPFRRGRRRS